jgi:hypothetical protein
MHMIKGESTMRFEHHERYLLDEWRSLWDQCLELKSVAPRDLWNYELTNGETQAEILSNLDTAATVCRNKLHLIAR